MPIDREIPKAISSNALDGVSAPRCTYPNCDCEIHLCKATLAREEKETQNMSSHPIPKANNDASHEITEWKQGRRFTVKGFDFELELKSYAYSVRVVATWGSKYMMEGYWSLRNGTCLNKVGYDFNLTEKEEKAIGEVCARLWVEDHPIEIVKK